MVIEKLCPCIDGNVRTQHTSCSTISTTVIYFFIISSLSCFLVFDGWNSPEVERARALPSVVCK